VSLIEILHPESAPRLQEAVDLGCMHPGEEVGIVGTVGLAVRSDAGDLLVDGIEVLHGGVYLAH